MSAVEEEPSVRKLSVADTYAQATRALQKHRSWMKKRSISSISPITSPVGEEGPQLKAPSWAWGGDANHQQPLRESEEQEEEEEADDVFLAEISTPGSFLHPSMSTEEPAAPPPFRKSAGGGNSTVSAFGTIASGAGSGDSSGSEAGRRLSVSRQWREGLRQRRLGKVSPISISRPPGLQLGSVVEGSGVGKGEAGLGILREEEDKEYEGGGEEGADQDGSSKGGVKDFLYAHNAQSEEGSKGSRVTASHSATRKKKVSRSSVAPSPSASGGLVETHPPSPKDSSSHLFVSGNLRAPLHNGTLKTTRTLPNSNGRKHKIVLEELENPSDDSKVLSSLPTGQHNNVPPPIKKATDHDRGEFSSGVLPDKNHFRQDDSFVDVDLNSSSSLGSLEEEHGGSKIDHGDTLLKATPGNSLASSPPRPSRLLMVKPAPQDKQLSYTQHKHAKTDPVLMRTGLTSDPLASHRVQRISAAVEDKSNWPQSIPHPILHQVVPLKDSAQPVDTLQSLSTKQTTSVTSTGFDDSAERDYRSLDVQSTLPVKPNADSVKQHEKNSWELEREESFSTTASDSYSSVTTDEDSETESTTFPMQMANPIEAKATVPGKHGSFRF